MAIQFKSEDKVRCPSCERYFHADDSEWNSNAGAPGTDGLCIECVEADERETRELSTAEEICFVAGGWNQPC